MAKIIIESCPCDQGHYGSTNYYCSECYMELKNTKRKTCPDCKVKFDEEPEFTVHGGFGGSDF